MRAVLACWSLRVWTPTTDCMILCTVEAAKVGSVCAQALGQKSKVAHQAIQSGCFMVILRKGANQSVQKRPSWQALKLAKSHCVSERFNPMAGKTTAYLGKSRAPLAGRCILNSCSGPTLK